MVKAITKLNDMLTNGNADDESDARILLRTAGIQASSSKPFGSLLPHNQQP